MATYDQLGHYVQPTIQAEFRNNLLIEKKTFSPLIKRKPSL